MGSAVTLYGIPNCDTIKKAKAWLNDHEVEFNFHDYRKQGLDKEQLQSMEAVLGWEAMLNRRGTTWRALSDPLKERIDLETAISVMLDNPAIIKRPILAKDEQLHLGFSAAQYQEIFG
jgi:Spx/MgsR family transcriptional regulator